MGKCGKTWNENKGKLNFYIKNVSFFSPVTCAIGSITFASNAAYLLFVEISMAIVIGTALCYAIIGIILRLKARQRGEGMKLTKFS
jgi:hypothetical protein